MSRPKNTVPKFCIDGSGRAFTKVEGRFISLGRGDTSEARQRYAEVLSDHAQGRLIARAKRQTAMPSDLTVNELLLQYVTKELPRFSSAEWHCQLGAIRILRETFGAVPVSDFGPLRFRVVRDAMIGKGWSRGFVNKQAKRLRAVFRWGVSWELVPNAVADALGTVKSLGAGESTAPESTPRMAIPLADIDTVRASLKQRHRDVLDLLLMTGARPGELIGLTTGDIDRTGEIWRADLAHHKTAHKGKSRTLFFNPTAQLILQKYLQADASARLFPFNRVTFGNVIKAACLRAGVTPFVPHQLRHTVATTIADELGTESAQRLLGHATAAMTLHYSKAADAKAIDAVKKLG
ncbi:MAG: site-specific integrase [Planctomycetaceae bacterium]|nr:site-specific integrase [Planctomycetaceae bacterium]